MIKGVVYCVLNNVYDANNCVQVWQLAEPERLPAPS
jgi:hypothetical protein